MATNLITTNELIGVRVVGGKSGMRRIGKVRYAVFHPRDRRVVGFIVKRPDLLWMFRRKDRFVSIKGYDIVDGRICIRPEPDAVGQRACQALGIVYDECVLWVGLPLICADGTELGCVGSVTFDCVTGAVASIETTAGATSNALLGKREIPADLVKGFSFGKGARLAQTGQEDPQEVTGAILVADEARDIAAEGGLAEKAGAGAAVISDKAGKAVKKTGERVVDTKNAFGEFKDEFRRESGAEERAAARALAKEGGKAAGTTTDKVIGAVDKGAKAMGAQIGKSRGMFAAFKDEYDKARRDK